MGNGGIISITAGPAKSKRRRKQNKTNPRHELPVYFGSSPLVLEVSLAGFEKEGEKTEKTEKTEKPEKTEKKNDGLALQQLNQNHGS